MRNITEQFGHLYHPLKALVVFKKDSTDQDYYVESYDMDSAGRPVNGHPLTLKEGNALAIALTVNEKKAQGFLIPEGLMPASVLHINSNTDGSVVWHTPAQSKKLLFLPSLDIPSGSASLPPLIWKARKGSLHVFAVQDEEIRLHTNLCKAPFFNIYTDGRVCMGSVRTNIPSHCSLEKFMQFWEHHFFNSYFSHLIGAESPVKGNIIQLWQHLLKSGEPFPTGQLLPANYQLKDLIH